MAIAKYIPDAETMTTAEARQTNSLLRQVRMLGRAGWLGGYTHYLVCTDGGSLCWTCTAKNYRRISESTRSSDGSGWGALVVSYVTGGEDEDTTCDHCHRPIA